MNEQPSPIPTLPVYPVLKPRGIPLFPDQKSQKPFMKAIKAHLKLKTKTPKKKIKDDIKWW